MDWKSVAEKIIQDDQNKWDRKVSGQELQIAEDGTLQVFNGACAQDLATTQMCHPV